MKPLTRSTTIFQIVTKMPKRHNLLNPTLTFLAVAALLMVGCARPGTPDGGPYDETPPQVVGATPKEGALSSKPSTIEIFFDEFVKLEKAAEKVVISPPQINMPEISTVGRSIKVKLLDSLRENTTYTIDFGDAIVDNNEGNPMGKYTYTFSTGERLDTMQVSGKVLNARNLEPIKGIVVGLHSDTTDTAFTTKPFERMARTNGSGEFTIKGVAPGTYRIFALQDADGDFVFSQKSEMIAFNRQTIAPRCFADVRPDTVWRDSTHYDSIYMQPYTHFVPDNVVLLAFTETLLDRHLLKSERLVPEHFDVYFTGPSARRPTIRGLNFDESKLVAECSANNDTVIYWIADTALVHTDSLFAEITYMANDSVGALVEMSEELPFVSRLPRSRQQKMEQQAYDEWAKEQEKRKKKGRHYQTVMPPPRLDILCGVSSSLDPYNNVVFTSPEPLAEVDTSKFHLYLKSDTLYLPAPHLVEQNPNTTLRYTLYGEWRPEQEYLLVVDSAAFKSIYGKPSGRIENRFSIPSLDTYSTFAAVIDGVADSALVVEMLNGSDNVERTERANGGKANFFFLKPGTYYMRAYNDRNGNGQWDEGNYSQGLQAEEVYYYPAPLTLRAKWDFEQAWNIHDLPLQRQKPEAITKQKPDKEKSIQKRNEERAKKWK